MNNFSLIGKFNKFDIINDSYVKLFIDSSSPTKKNLLISITTSNKKSIYKLQKGDLLGIKGFIDIQDTMVTLIASNITWISKTKNKLQALYL